jgi:F0F1-type ATP synthase assembly protein I
MLQHNMRRARNHNSANLVARLDQTSRPLAPAATPAASVESSVGRIMFVEMPRRPFGTWTSVFLVWNGLGALLALAVQSGISLKLIALDTEGFPSFVLGLLCRSWVPSLPFTTLVVAIVLWRSHRATVSRVLLLYSGAALVVWGGLILIIFAYLGAFDLPGR